MDREIKFRAKRKDNSEWVYGSYTNMSGIKPSWNFIEFVFEGRRCRYEVAPKTVGQFTGLKDCNGKDIYEGDIVVREGEMGEFIIKWHNSGFVMDNGQTYDRLCDYNPSKLTVIGNIHTKEN